MYSREILHGLARAHPEIEWLFCYRPHRLGRALKAPVPRNVRRVLMQDVFPFLPPWRSDLFHGLNQRMPAVRLRRSVVTFHDLFVISGEYSTPAFRRRFARQARDAAARADLIVAVSSFTAGQVETLLQVDASRVRVIPHGFRPLPAAPPQRRREPIVLHVGAIQKRKNIERLVRAFEMGVPPGWRLVLAGSEGFGSDAIAAAIAASPRRADIIRTGFVPDAELGAWYAKASVFAFPSLDEGFGIPVLEAMAAGVPVLTSSRSALPETAGDAALLVDPQSVDQIAAGLRELTSNDQLGEELRGRGYKRAAEFSWEQAVERTWSVYRELLD